MPKANTGRPMGRPPAPKERTKKPHPTTDAPHLPGSTSIPMAPVGLYDDGLILWNHIWTAGKQWLSPESDRTMIEMLCRAHDEAENIRRGIWEGHIARFYETANGQIVTHPMVNQLKELRTQMTTWLSAIGFSPSDRARLGLAEVRVRDELDELAQRRAQRAAGS
jgi:P27 family predicted phage terminase small subunit